MENNPLYPFLNKLVGEYLENAADIQLLPDWTFSQGGKEFSTQPFVASDESELNKFSTAEFYIYEKIDETEENDILRGRITAKNKNGNIIVNGDSDYFDFDPDYFMRFEDGGEIEDEDFDDEDDFEPEDNDCFISDNVRGGYDVSCSEEYIGNFEDFDSAVEAVKKWQKENNWFPNVWFVNERGSIDIVDIHSAEGLDEYAGGGYMKARNYARGGGMGIREQLEKELRKLQRDLNSPRLMTYREGDNSEEEQARQRERAAKMERFNEVLSLLRQSEGEKYARGGGFDQYGNPYGFETSEFEERESYIEEFLKGKKYPLSDKDIREISKETGYSAGDIIYVSQKMHGDIQYNPKYARGGMIRPIKKDEEYRYMGSSSIEKDIMDKIRPQLSGLEFAGNFYAKGWQKSGEGYLYFLDEYDKEFTKDVRLNPGEKLFRYYTRTTAIGGMVPLVKINLNNGLIYFMESKDFGDETIDFSTKGIKAEYINLVSSALEDEYARGGEMPDYTKTMGLVKVKFKNPKYNYSTNVAGDITESEARRYFVGKKFDVGKYPRENMQVVEDIEFFPKGTYDDTMAEGGEMGIGNNTYQGNPYRMLDRLRSDNDYFLGYGNRHEKHLWAGSVDEQINEMKRIWNGLKVKPDWLSMEDILEYEKKMKSQYAKGGEMGFPPKGELRNSDGFLLKYEKKNGEYEFYVYKPVTDDISAYSRTRHICVNADCPSKMTYSQFINYLYAETYLDDKRYANGDEMADGGEMGIGNIADEYESHVMQHYMSAIKRYERERNSYMAKVMKADLDDHMAVIQSLKDNDIKTAFVLWSNMDTAAREEITNNAYDLITKNAPTLKSRRLYVDEKGIIKKEDIYAKGGSIEVVGRGNKGAFRRREYENMTEEEVADWWIQRGYSLSKVRSESKLKPFTFYIEKYDNGGEMGGDRMEVAKTIYAQLGRLTLAMLGAYNFVGDVNSLSFRIKGSKKVNYIKITLTPMDVYTVEFGKIRKIDPMAAISMSEDEYMNAMYKVVNVVENVYFDDLHSVIENNTELYTKFADGGELCGCKH